METFTVCKIEAGRAILLSQEDFELIEFPAKLLPNDCKNVNITINSSSSTNEGEGDNKMREMIKEVLYEYYVDERQAERIKEEIEMEGFLRIESLGSTAAILSWQRSFSDIFGSSVNLENVLLNIESEEEGYLEEYVDFVMKGQKTIHPSETRCRINLPIDLKVSLVVNSSVGCFKTREIKLRTMKFDDFSGIFLLTDLTDQPSIDRLEFVRDQGGYISRSYSADHPITAVITDSFDSELFRIGIDNNLPVVSGTWLEALVATKELPHFQDHLLKRSL